MRRLLLFLLPFSLVLGSCSMEKRLYRKGWYTEHSQKIAYTQNNFVAEQEVPAKITSDKVSSIPDSTAKIPSDSDQTVSRRSNTQRLNPIAEIKKIVRDDPPEKKKRMSYSEAVTAMSKAGCSKPDKAASAIYWLSIISIFSSWLFGFGILLAIVTLVISIFAINKVAADGNCVAENIAIIKAGQRNCWYLLISYLIVAILVTLLVLGIINWSYYHQ